MSKKAALNVITKSMFAVFLVIIVALITYLVFYSRQEILIEKETFDYYDIVNDFFLTLLSKPECFSMGEYEKDGWENPKQAVLSLDKLASYPKEDDLSCVDNFHFLYFIEIKDLNTGLKKQFGLKNKLPQVEREIGVSLPVAIYIPPTPPTGPIKIDYGRATITAYIGNVPRFYGLIKEVCKTKQKEIYTLNTDYAISYSKNFCVGKVCFKPFFECKVKEFDIPKGAHMVIIEYEEGAVEIKI